jgi:transposase, IS5 family
VDTVTITAANESNVEQIALLLHGKEQQVWATRATGAPRRASAAMTCDGISPPDRATSPSCPRGRRKAVRKHEHRNASVREGRAPVRVIKRKFGLMKFRFRGLAKNTAHVVTLFAMSNCGRRDDS